MFDWVDFQLAGLSAGHCGRAGDTMHTCYDNRCTIGLIYANGHDHEGLQWGDWLLYDVPWDAENRLIYIKNNWQRYVDEMAHDNLDVGQVVCKRGVTSRTTCGKVTTALENLYVVENYKHVYYRHLQCGKMQAYGGDSGGPVYQPLSNTSYHPTARAVGIASAAQHDILGRIVKFCWTPVWIVATQSHAVVLDY